MCMTCGINLYVFLVHIEAIFRSLQTWPLRSTTVWNNRKTHDIKSYPTLSLSWFVMIPYDMNLLIQYEHTVNANFMLTVKGSKVITQIVFLFLVLLMTLFKSASSFLLCLFRSKWRRLRQIFSRWLGSDRAKWRRSKTVWSSALWVLNGCLDLVLLCSILLMLISCAIVKCLSQNFLSK